MDPVYKSCNNNWIVSLQPIEGTITNVGRDDVVDPRYAKFRGNKFMVVGIEHKYDPTLTTKSITSSDYDKQNLVYKVGKIVAVEDYDMNRDAVCTAGIHFFLTKEAAFSHEMPTDAYLKQMSQPYITYHENECKDGDDDIHCGPFISYYENGVTCYEGTYDENANLCGLYVEYYPTGIKKREANYSNNLIDGLFTSYYVNGGKHIETVYKNGNRCGLYVEYYENGTRKTTRIFKNDILQGLHVDYYKNGNRRFEANYKNDKLHGLCTVFHDDGTIHYKDLYENGEVDLVCISIIIKLIFAIPVILLVLAMIFHLSHYVRNLN